MTPRWIRDLTAVGALCLYPLMIANCSATASDVYESSQQAQGKIVGTCVPTEVVIDDGAQADWVCGCSGRNYPKTSANRPEARCFDFGGFAWKGNIRYCLFHPQPDCSAAPAAANSSEPAASPTNPPPTRPTPTAPPANDPVPPAPVPNDNSVVPSVGLTLESDFIFEGENNNGPKINPLAKDLRPNQCMVMYLDGDYNAIVRETAECGGTSLSGCGPASQKAAQSATGKDLTGVTAYAVHMCQ